MATVVIGARCLLAVVFATAAVTKLLDMPGSRRALAEFGVPHRAIPLTALLLPLMELASAVALISPSSARWGAAGAIALLLAFIGGIANAMSRGKAPDCHCFGQLHSAPAGRSTLARNAVLGALAAIVVSRGPGPAVDAWVAARTAAELVAVGTGLAAVVFGALSLRLWLDNRGLRRDLADVRQELAALPSGLPVGAPAPSFSLQGVRGETSTLNSLRERGRPVLLMFVDPHCGPCRLLLPELGRWQATLTDRVTIALISSGSPEENLPPLEEHGIVDLLLQEELEVMDAYRVRATPSAVVVTADGRIASAPVAGVATIEPLIRLTLHSDAALLAAGR